MADLKKNYIYNIGKQKYKLHTKNGFRIATYNVHYWCDVFEKNTMNNILDDIKYINADIICLQEAIIGSIYKVNNKTINTEHIIHLLEQLGYYIIFCNNVPTWFNSIYGNMMCVKKKFMNILKNKNVSIHGLKKLNTSCVSGGVEQISETRCFIQLILPKYIIICTHLDICDEQTRTTQIKVILNIIKESKKKIILLGDFNSTDINDSLQKENIMKYVYNNQSKWINNNIIKKIKSSGFKSVINTPTTWSNIQTDYIFTKGIPRVSTQVLYTPHSDHLPLIIDIPQQKTKKI